MIYGLGVSQVRGIKPFKGIRDCFRKWRETSAPVAFAPFCHVHSRWPWTLNGRAGTEKLETGWPMRLVDVLMDHLWSSRLWESVLSGSGWLSGTHPVSPVPAGGADMGCMVQRNLLWVIWDQWIGQTANWVSFVPERQLCPCSWCNPPEACPKASEHT